MSLNVTFNGTVYIIPETGEVGWGGNTTSYLVAIAAGALQKTGGSFTLSAETDFGASFGLQSLYYKSRNSNVASTGIIRLNNNSDAISWRNAANNADLPLIVNASNELLYNGNQVLTGTGPSNYVSSITGTANQVIASSPTGAVTLSLPQSINTGAGVQFSTLALGSTLTTSAILSLSSTTLGFLPPRMTTVQRDAITTPATGLLIYNTSTNQYNSYDGVAWVALAMSGGGTVNVGTQYQLGYYATTGTSISGLSLITASRALESDINGLPVASTVTATELSYVSGVTSSIQTQLNTKAVDSAVVHLAGTETITGNKTFQNGIILNTAGQLNCDVRASFTGSSVDIGASGDAGLLDIYPATVGRGTFRLIAADNGVGDPIVTVTNASHTISRTYTIPDAGTNANFVLTEGTQTINGAKTFGSSLLAPNGSASLPSYAFTNDPDCGLYRIAAGRVGISADGTTIFDATNIRVEIFNVPVHLGNGTAVAPSLSFSLDSDCGIYRIGTNDVGIAANGTQVASFSSGGVDILGTTTNDSAATGFVGEEIIQTRLRSARTALTTGTAANVTATALTLSAGDWDISGVVQFEADPTTTVSERRASISTTSATQPSDNTIAVADSSGQMTILDNNISATANKSQFSAIISQHRVALSGTTTFYLVASSTFGVSTMEVYGTIRARRMR